MALPARLQHVAEQEQPGQAKTVLQVLVRPAVRPALAFAQEGRQPQQPVAVGLAGRPRHRAAGLWRDVDQVRGRAGGGAVFQIEAEAEFGQHREFEPDEVGRRAAGIVKVVQRAVEHLEDVLVRIALRQQPHQRSQMGDAIGRVRRRQQGGRAQARALNGVISEMLVEPRPPHRGDAVARLQQRPHPLARTAAHQAEMTAMLARQQLDDGGGFAMPPHAQHDAFVGPFHGGSLQEFAEGRSGCWPSFRGDAKHRTRICDSPVRNCASVGLMLRTTPE